MWREQRNLNPQCCFEGTEKIPPQRILVHGPADARSEKGIWGFTIELIILVINALTTNETSESRTVSERFPHPFWNPTCATSLTFCLLIRSEDFSPVCWKLACTSLSHDCRSLSPALTRHELATIRRTKVTNTLTLVIDQAKQRVASVLDRDIDNPKVEGKHFRQQINQTGPTRSTEDDTASSGDGNDYPTRWWFLDALVCPSHPNFQMVWFDEDRDHALCDNLVGFGLSLCLLRTPSRYKHYTTKTTKSTRPPTSTFPKRKTYHGNE